MDNRVITYSKKIPKKQHNESGNSPVHHVKPVPFGITRTEAPKIEKLNLKNIAQHQVLKLDSLRSPERVNRSPLKSEFYQKYSKLAQTKSPIRKDNQETFQTLKPGRAKKSNQIKNINRRISSLVHSMLENLNKNRNTLLEDDKTISYRTGSTERNNNKKYLAKSKLLPSLNISSSNINNEVLLNNKLNSLINEKNVRQIENVSLNEKEDTFLKSNNNNIKDKLSENFVNFLKKHRYSTLLIGSKRYEGKSGEYYLNTQIKDTSNNKYHNDKQITTSGNQDSIITPQKIKRIEIDFGPKNKFERNWEIPSIDLDLTPIPTKRNFINNTLAKDEYSNAERTAVLIRRIEYSLKLKGVKKKYTEEMREGMYLRSKIILIQNWWRKMNKYLSEQNRNALMIQKIFRGYFARKALTFIIKDFNRFIFFTEKIENTIQSFIKKHVFNDLYLKFAHLSQAKYVRSKINLIRKNFLNFYYKKSFRRQLLIENTSKPINKRLSSAFYLLKNFCNYKAEALIIQTNWRGYLMRNSDYYHEINQYNPLLKVYMKYKYSSKYQKVKEYAMEVIDKLKKSLFMLRYNKKIPILFKKIKKLPLRKFYRLFLRKLEEYRFVKLRLKILSRSLKEILPIYRRYIISKHFQIWKKEYKSIKSVCNKIKFLYRGAFKFLYWKKFLTKLNLIYVRDKIRLLFTKSDQIKLKNYFSLFKETNRRLFIQESKLVNILNSKHYIDLKFYLEKLRINNDNRVELYIHKFKNINEGLIILDKSIMSILHNVIKTCIFLPHNKYLKLNTILKYYRKINLLERMRRNFINYFQLTNRISNTTNLKKASLKNLIQLKHFKNTMILKKSIRKLRNKVYKLEKLKSKNLLNCYRKYEKFELMNLGYYFRSLDKFIKNVNLRENLLEKHLVKNDSRCMRQALNKFHSITKDISKSDIILRRNVTTSKMFSLLEEIVNFNLYYIYQEVFLKSSLIRKSMIKLINKIGAKDNISSKVFWIRKYYNNVVQLRRKEEKKKMVTFVLINLLKRKQLDNKYLIQDFFLKVKNLEIKSLNKEETIQSYLLKLVKKSYLISINMYFMKFKDLSQKFQTKEYLFKHIFSNQIKKDLKSYFTKMKENQKKEIFIKKIKGIYNFVNSIQEIIELRKNSMIYFDIFLSLKRKRILESIIHKQENDSFIIKKSFLKLLRINNNISVRNFNLNKVFLIKYNKENNWSLNKVKYFTRIWKERVQFIKFKFQACFNSFSKIFSKQLQTEMNIIFQIIKENTFCDLNVNALPSKVEMISKSMSKIKGFYNKKFLISMSKYFYKFKLINTALKIKEENHPKSLNSFKLPNLIKGFIVNDLYTSKHIFFQNLRKCFIIDLFVNSVENKMRLFNQFILHSIKNHADGNNKNNILLNKLKLKYLKLIVNNFSATNTHRLKYYFSHLRNSTDVVKIAPNNKMLKEDEIELLIKKRIVLYKVLSKSKNCKIMQKHFFSIWKSIKLDKKMKFYKTFIHNVSSPKEKFLNKIIDNYITYSNTLLLEFFKRLKSMISSNNVYKSSLSPNVKKLQLLFTKKNFTQMKIISKNFIRWKNIMNKYNLKYSAFIIQNIFQTIIKNNKKNCKNEESCKNDSNQTIQKMMNLFEGLANKWKFILSIYFIRFKKALKLNGMLISLVKFQNYYRYTVFRRKLNNIRDSKHNFKMIGKVLLKNYILKEVKELKRTYNNVNVLLYISKLQKSKLLVILRTYFNNIEMSFRFFWMIECIRKKYKQVYSYYFFRRIWRLKINSFIKFIQIFWKTKRILIRNRKMNEVLHNAVYEQTYSNLKALKNRFLKWLKEVHTYKLKKSISIINKYIYAYLVRKRIKKLFIEYCNFLPVKLTMNFIELAKEMIK